MKLKKSVGVSVVVAALSSGLSGCAVALEESDTWDADGEVREIEQKLVVSISTLAQLRAMVPDGDYQLTANIDASATQTPGQEFRPIGNQYFPYSGTFDGGNFTISNLKIKAGLFGTGVFAGAGNATIKNLILTNVTVVGDSDVGAIAGWISDTVVENCSVTGTVTSISGMWPRANAGMLVGTAYTGGSLWKVWAQGTVNGLVRSAGGIVGQAVGSQWAGEDRPSIREAFSNVTITPTFGAGSWPVASGGIVGTIQNAHVLNVLNTGNILGDYSGGVIGSAIANSNGLNSLVSSAVTHAVVGVNNVPNRTGAIGHYSSSAAFADCRGILYNTSTDAGILPPGTTNCQWGYSASVLRAPKPAPDPLYAPYIFGSPVDGSPAGSDGTWDFGVWALNSASQYTTLINIPWSVQPK